MSINSISNNSLTYYSPLLDSSSNEQAPLEELTQEKASSQKETEQSAISPGRKQLQAYASAGNALASMKENGVAITRDSIAKEIEQKEGAFQLLVSSSLKALGVDEDIEFKIAMDDNGGIIVNSSHPDKDKVQNFFDNNPEFADVFKEIESLKNLGKSMEPSTMSSINLRRSIQAENMSAYFEGMEQAQGSSYSPLILSYSKNSMLALSGINVNV